MAEVVTKVSESSGKNLNCLASSLIVVAVAGCGIAMCTTKGWEDHSAFDRKWAPPTTPTSTPTNFTRPTASATEMAFRIPRVRAQSTAVPEVAGEPEGELPFTPCKPNSILVEICDTLTRLARIHDTTVVELVKLNEIRNPNYIKAGSCLRVRQ